jgi:hypothetical protein
VLVYGRAAVSLAHSVPPAQRRIALVGRADAATSGDERTQHAMRLFDTMLWVLKGTTRDAWAMATPEDADIVVVHRDDAREVASWRSRGKLVVEITHDQAADGGAHVLNYPFPAKRVLELLEKLSGELDSRGVAMPARKSGASLESVPPRAAPSQDRWALAESLRTLRAVRNDALWLVARDGVEPVLWMRGDGALYFATEPFTAALRADPTLVPRLELRDGYPPPKTRVRERPGTEFFWFAGFGAGEVLAPWLNAQARYRVTAWPDFGVIRPDAGVLRAVALLAAQPQDPQSLATGARISLGQAHRVLNALSLCEVLTTAAATSAGNANASAIAQPRGGFAGFLRKLRGHLGLGEAA